MIDTMILKIAALFVLGMVLAADIFMITIGVLTDWSEKW